MGKAPDTRNKLESVKGPKKRKVSKNKSFKEIKAAMEDYSQPIRVRITPKKTKGQLFKEAHGFSRSIARAMRKNGFHISESSFEAYKKLRGDRKKVARKLAQDKRSISRVKKSTSDTKSKKKK